MTKDESTNDDFFAIMPEELVAAMDARGARKAVIVRDLARYYGLLKQGMRSIDGLFTPDEYLFLADIACGTALDANFIDLLPYSVEDALADIGQKWEIDGPSLMDKVKSLDEIARYALVDSIEQFGTRTDRGELTPISEVGQLPAGTGNFAPFTRYDEYFSQ